MRLAGGSEIASGFAMSKPKKKHSLVPACIRSKKKSHRAFFYTDEKEDISNRQRENEQGRNKVIVHELPSAESSVYKFEAKAVNEICKPRSFKYHSEVPSRTTGVTRIGKLENQVEEMRQELTQMRKEFIPQHDVERYAELENRLKELNLILCDLRSNCVKGTCSSDMQQEELQKMQYINPPYVRSETGTQTVQERHVEEKVLPAPREKHSNEREEQEQKICICDDCECKESGECLLNHQIEPHFIMLDEPKPPPPRKVESHTVIYVPLRRPRSDELRQKPSFQEPSPSKQEPLPRSTSHQRPPKKLVDSGTEMTGSSRKSSPERRKTKDSYTEMEADSSYNQMEEGCFGVCGDPKCSAGERGEHSRETKSGQRMKDRTEKPSHSSRDNVRKGKHHEDADDGDGDDEDDEVDARKQTYDDEEDRRPVHNLKESERKRKHSHERSVPENGSLHKERSYCLYCDNKEVPIISENLLEEILRLIRGHSSHDIALTILLQTNELYHINVSEMSSGLNIGCLYATEEGIKSGSKEHIFEEFLTFFIVDARNTVDQKNKILHHTFEFIRECDK